MNDRTSRRSHLPILLAAVAIILATGEVIYRANDPSVTAHVTFPNPSSEVVDQATGLTNTYMSFEGIHVTKGQKQSYHGMLALIAVFALAIYGFQQFGLLNHPRLGAAAVWIIGLTATAYLPAVSHLFSAYSANARVVGIALAYVAYRWQSVWLRPQVQSAVGKASILFLIYWIGLGLIRPINLTAWNPGSLEELQSHWALILGTADALATGSEVHSRMGFGYGNWSTLIALSGSHLLGPLTLGSYLRVIVVLQLAYFAMLLSAWLIYSRGQWVGCAVALLFSVWCFHFGGTCSFFFLTPNHSAWRYLIFAVAILAQALTLRSSDFLTVLLLGFVSGLGLAQNFETGIAITVGNLVCITLRMLQTFPKKGFIGTLSCPLAMLAGDACRFSAMGWHTALLWESFPIPATLCALFRSFAH